MKKEEKEKLILKGRIIDRLIYNKNINNNEIIDLFNTNINDILCININKYSSQKEKTMFEIYFNPYILYFSKNINSEVQDKLVDFVKYRYLMEMYEFDNKLNCGDISKSEYDFEVDKILNNYFYSSPIGINIGRLIEKEEKEKVKTKKFEN